MSLDEIYRMSASGDLPHIGPDKAAGTAAVIERAPARRSVKDETPDGTRIKVKTARRVAALSAHYLVRALGYLELTDVYAIELTAARRNEPLPGYVIERADGRAVD